MISSALKNWLPYKLISEKDQLLCKWFYAGEKKFSEPFFDETILKCLSYPFNSKAFKCVSNVEVLPEWSLAIEHVKPSVIIFHISRCGSTLLSQLLSLSGRNIVLSEVPFLDEILRLPYKHKKISEDASNRLFKATLAFYGRKRETWEEHLFIKADSWHILFYKRLRRMFPDVLFVLLYRNPGEVIRSHQKKRGIQAVPGLLEPELFGFNQNVKQGWDLDCYLSNVLEKYFTAYRDVVLNDNQVILANYSNGMPDVINKIVDKTGICFSEKERETMKERIIFNAKYPDKKFIEDQPIHKPPLCLQGCFELYDQLKRFQSLH